MAESTSSWQRWLQLLERENQGKAPLDRLRQDYPGGLMMEALCTPSSPEAAPSVRIPWRSKARPEVSLSQTGIAGAASVVAALGALADREVHRMRVELDAVTAGGKDADAGARQGLDGWRFSHADELREATTAAREAGARLSLGGGAFASPLQALLDAADGTTLVHEARVDPWMAVVRGRLAIEHLKAARRDAIEVITQRVQEQRPGVVIEVRGDDWEQLGAAPATLLGIVTATVVEALRDGVEASLSLEEICANISVALPAGRDSFLRIALFRAARLLLARVLEVAGAPQPPAIHVAAIDDLRGRTLHDRWVNQLRTTAGAFSGIVGGADEISTLAADALVHGGSALATRIALQAPLVLLEESWLDATADPAAGAWHLDTLTTRLAEEAWSLMTQIEADGGLGFALGNAWLAERVAKDAAQRENAIGNGATPLLGTTAFAWLEEPPAEPPLAEALQPAALAAAARDARERTPMESLPSVDATLTGLRLMAQQGGTLECLQARAQERAGRNTHETLPTHPPALHATWEQVSLSRDATPWESLRARVAGLRRRNAALGAVSLLVVGDAIALKPRTAFARGWAEAAGFTVHTLTTESATPDAIRRTLGEAEATGWTLLVGADTDWPTWAAEAVAAAREAGNHQVWIAGRAPKDAGDNVLGGAEVLLKLGAPVLDFFDTLVTALEERP